jgi:hypothetical protein
MREMDGMSYADLAAALDVTVPAVKSLLVRARLGLVEAAEARTTDCAVIRDDLMSAYDRGVKASGRARRHMRECSGCREYRTALRSVRSSLAALSPGAGGAAASSGGVVAGGTVAVGGATACKVAAVVCTAALTAGGAVEVKHLTDKDGSPARARSAESAAAAGSNPSPSTRRAALTSAAAAAPAPFTAPVRRAAGPPAARERWTATRPDRSVLAPPVVPTYAPESLGGAEAPEETVPTTGGVTAPDEPVVSETPLEDGATTPLTPTTEESAPAEPTSGTTEPSPATPVQEPEAAPASEPGAPAPPPPGSGTR